jgi:hypothetical protein
MCLIMTKTPKTVSLAVKWPNLYPHIHNFIGFIQGTPILSCDALPTSHGKGVEFFKKELNDDTKKFHWNPEISITTDDDISNPDCGVTPAPTAKPTAEPTSEPTKKPTAEPTAEPTKRPSMMVLPKLKLGATVTPAPTPAPKRKLGAGTRTFL